MERKRGFSKREMRGYTSILEALDSAPITLQQYRKEHPLPRGKRRMNGQVRKPAK